MRRAIPSAMLVLGLAGCAAGVKPVDLESTKPVLYLSVRPADQVYACLEPAVRQWGRAADVTRHPGEQRVDVTVYEDQFPQRQDYFLVRIEPTPGGSATRFFSGGVDHPRVSAAQVEDLLRGCTG